MNLTKLPLLEQYINENKFTRENFIKQWKTIERKHQIRQKFLTATFSSISNSELLEEFRKRVEHQVIKLSLDSKQDYISGEPKSKKLQNKISKKLALLSKLLDELDEARIINSDDPDTWDSDTLYDLVANLKEIIKLLEDKEHPKENAVSAKQKDEFGQPLILEAGLLSLVDEYHEDEENEDF